MDGEHVIFIAPAASLIAANTFSLMARCAAAPTAITLAFLRLLFTIYPASLSSL